LFVSFFYCIFASGITKRGVTMDTLHIITVVALVLIGGYIYWNKTRG
jgi:hypothetical protein